MLRSSSSSPKTNVLVGNPPATIQNEGRWDAVDTTYIGFNFKVGHHDRVVDAQNRNHIDNGLHVFRVLGYTDDTEFRLVVQVRHFDQPRHLFPTGRAPRSPRS